MIERLEATLTKYNQLQTELMSEDVLKNINKTREISKEIADLEEVVTEYKKYKKAVSVDRYLSCITIYIADVIYKDSESGNCIQ